MIGLSVDEESVVLYLKNRKHSFVKEECFYFAFVLGGREGKSGEDESDGEKKEASL